ncbi:MAG: hypothetical protein Q7S04_00490 [Candidatus Moranbacteria bacterium]|nr:hypothetical protein [Candidatus Moranbacteria bacterium]
MSEFSPIEALKVPVKKVARAAENAFFNYERNQSTEASWDTLFDNKAGKFLRTQALFTVIRDMVPDSLFEKLTGRFYKYQKGGLPIDPEKYTFDEKRVGGGGECNVYRLNSLDSDLPSLVIKIDQFISRSTDKMLTRAKAVKSEYEEKKELYRDLPELIPDEFHFIGKSPRGGKPALLTIQEFLGNENEMRDLFRGISKEELLEILRQNSRLQADFRKFAGITLERAREKDEMIDTLGDKNLVLIQREGNTSLIFLDPHVTKHPVADVKESARIRADLDYLEGIVATLDNGE